MNGNENATHDHILRPRAIKPGNPAILHTRSEEGLLAVATSAEPSLNGTISGQTR